MIRLGARLVSHYEAGKRARDVLDYDDLVFRSQALLEKEDAAWVRYRLDGGIDHILVDEAQDTSAEQWRIVDCLAGEFFAGAGARGDATRTLFARAAARSASSGRNSRGRPAGRNGAPRARAGRSSVARRRRPGGPRPGS
ncbi:MAG: UvrD-helicase domain-containing protein [Alphaproteobacteria bacterium]